MFYLENTFYIRVRDCDDSLIVSFRKLLDDLWEKAPFQFSLGGQPNWDNLMQWFVK